MVGLLNTGEFDAHCKGFCYIIEILSVNRIKFNLYMFYNVLTASVEFLQDSVDLPSKLKGCQQLLRSFFAGVTAHLMTSNTEHQDENKTIIKMPGIMDYSKGRFS